MNANLKNDLQEYIANGNLDEVKRILNYNNVDYIGTLYIAAKNSQNHILKFLLDFTDVHTTVSLYRALHSAVYILNVEAVRILTNEKNITYFFNFRRLFIFLNYNEELNEDIKNKKIQILDLLLSDDQFLKSLFLSSNVVGYTANIVEYKYNKKLYCYYKNNYTLKSNSFIVTIYRNICKVDDIDFFIEVYNNYNDYLTIENLIQFGVYYNSVKILKFLLQQNNINFKEISSSIAALYHKKREKLLCVFLEDGRILKYLDKNNISLHLKKQIVKVYNLDSTLDVDNLLNFIQ